MKVSWDYDIPHYMESHKINVPNHQAVCVSMSSPITPFPQGPFHDLVFAVSFQFSVGSFLLKGHRIPDLSWPILAHQTQKDQEFVGLCDIIDV